MSLEIKISVTNSWNRPVTYSFWLISGPLIPTTVFEEILCNNMQTKLIIHLKLLFPLPFLYIFVYFFQNIIDIDIKKYRWWAPFPCLRGLLVVKKDTGLSY